MIKKLKAAFYYLFKYPYFKWTFFRFGKKSNILFPFQTEYPKNISIGEKVLILGNAWLAANPLTGNKNCKLIIDDGAYIGRFSHIYATSRIEIGKKVLIADKVYVSDNLHGYENVSIPIIEQSIVQVNEVYIGEGCWIGENVCIIGASVGKHSVIGANSVVTRDIPDYCIAVGAPAKIIKRYNFETSQWQKTDGIGEFI